MLSTVYILFDCQAERAYNRSTIKFSKELTMEKQKKKLTKEQLEAIKGAVKEKRLTESTLYLKGKAKGTLQYQLALSSEGRVDA